MLLGAFAVSAQTTDQDEAYEADALLELVSMTKPKELSLQPRCGAEFSNATCSGLGEKGKCCSKWGFCGTKPFHCIVRLGCQSECNDDIDFKASEGPVESPIPVIFKPRENGPKVIIKTLSPSVPLCANCPKSHNHTIIRLFKNANTKEPSKREQDAAKLLGQLIPEPPKKNKERKNKSDISVFGNVDFEKAIRQLRKMSKTFKKLTGKVLTLAKKRLRDRKNGGSSSDIDFGKFPKPSGSLQLNIDVRTPQEPSAVGKKRHHHHHKG